MVLQDHRIINLTTGLYCPNGKGHVRTICVGEEANLGGSVYRHSQDSKQEYAHKYREKARWFRIMQDRNKIVWKDPEVESRK